MDAFTPDLPEHLIGAFDIVHIRAIASAVKGNAVEPLLKNLVKMLSMESPSSRSRVYIGSDVCDDRMWASMFCVQRNRYSSADGVFLISRA